MTPRKQIQNAIEDASYYSDEKHFKIPHDYAIPLIDKIDKIAEYNAINFARFVMMSDGKFKRWNIKDIYKEYSKL